MTVPPIITQYPSVIPIWVIGSTYPMAFSEMLKLS